MAILNKNSLLGTVAVAALLAGATGALAGGFAIREQSTSAQGASFAGNAANSDLSAMFWNPAGAANVQGFGTESHYTLIIPRAHIDVTGTSHDTSTPQGVGLNALMNSGKFANNSGDIGKIAALGATYLAYQFVNYDPNLFLGLAMNSPFGLKTKPEDVNYKGSVLGRETSLLTLNVSPSLAYKITPNLVVSAGAQMQYADATLTFGGTPSAFDTRFEGTGLAFGGTAGVMWTPAAGTTVGLGYRSQLKQQLSGSYSNNQGIGALGVPPALGGFASVEARTNLNLPDIVSLSLRQSIADRKSTRLNSSHSS